MKPLLVLTALLIGVVFHLRYGQCCIPMGVPMGGCSCPSCAICGPPPRPAVECRCPLPGTPYAFNHNYCAIQCNSFLAPYLSPPPLPPPIPPPLLIPMMPIQRIPYPYIPPVPVMPEGTTLLHLKPPPHPPPPRPPNTFITPIRKTFKPMSSTTKYTTRLVTATTSPTRTTTTTDVGWTNSNAPTTSSPIPPTVENYYVTPGNSPLLPSSTSPIPSATISTEVLEEKMKAAPYSIYGDQLCTGVVQARSFEPNVSLAAEKCAKMGCAAVNIRDYKYHDEYHDRSNSAHFEYNRGHSHHHHDDHQHYGSNSDGHHGYHNHQHSHHVMEAVYMRRVDSRQHSSGYYCVTTAEVPLTRNHFSHDRQHGSQRSNARKHLVTREVADAGKWLIKFPTLSYKPNKTIESKMAFTP